MEQVRQKRLAKLTGTNKGNPPDSTADTTVPSPAAKAASVQVSAEGRTSAGQANTKPTTATADAQANTKPTRTSPPSPASSVSKIALFMQRADWESRTIQFILQITNNLERSSSSIPYFSGVQDLSFSNIEPILYSRLALSENIHMRTSLFEYLISCWSKTKEATRKIHELSDKSNHELSALIETRVRLIHQLSSLIISYCRLVLTFTDNFVQPPGYTARGASIITDILILHSASIEDHLPLSFFTEFVTSLDTTGLQNIFVTVFKGIHTLLRSHSFASAYQPCLNAYKFLFQFPTLIDMYTTHPTFIPIHGTPKTIELLSALGPLFSRLSIFPDTDPSIAEKYFGSDNPLVYGTDLSHEMHGFPVGSRNGGDVRSCMSSLRQALTLLILQIQAISLQIIKASPSSKQLFLSYFLKALSINTSRGKMLVDRKSVSSEGYMYTLFRCCLMLCAPITDSNYSKVHLIDPHYLYKCLRINISEETRMSIEPSVITIDSTYTPNFVSDLFYITLAMTHYGYMSSIRMYDDYIKHVRELDDHISKMQKEKDSGLWGAQGRIHEEMLVKYKMQLDKLVGEKLAMECALLCPDTICRVVDFMNLSMIWMMRCMCGDKFDGTWSRISRGDLPSDFMKSFPEKSDIFSGLPEWIVEDIVEFYLFILKSKADTFETMDKDSLMTFIMVVLTNYDYIKNPYLKSKFVEIMFFFTLPLYQTMDGQPVGSLDSVFYTHPLCKSHLVHNVIKVYIEVEHTGAHSQFYDKFNIRYNISQILKKVWNDISYKQKVIDESCDSEFFVRFVNLLMNDTTYLLDESLSKLTEIKNLQNEILTPQYASSSADHKKETEKNLAQAEKVAHSCMQLGNETVNMMKYLTTENRIATVFMEPYIIDRFTSMLDYNLSALVGKRCIDLKVRNPEKYSFDPKKLVASLLTIYLNLSHRVEFVAGVARDGRSYSKDIFYRAIQIMNRNAAMNYADLERIKAFVESIEQNIANEKRNDDMMGEIPEEFLDPLMYTVMEDPVILPSSQMTVDRSTIMSVLLSDSHDPFNRAPLTLDMVIPNTELKAKIDAWEKNKAA